MCQRCVDAVKRHYPELTEDEYGDFLFGTTSFPFGSPEMVEAQLAKMKAETDGTIEAAYEYADRVMEEQMANQSRE